jgi:hypothetical protein
MIQERQNIQNVKSGRATEFLMQTIMLITMILTINSTPFGAGL